MQTYTHLFVGAVGGMILFPHQPLMELATAAGAIAPDLVMVPQFVVDKIAGRKPLADMSPTVKLLLPLSHSIPAWALLCIIGFVWWPLLLAFAVGGLLFHIALDTFSHGDPRFNTRDPPYLWPLKQTIHIGNWDYRLQNGSLWPLKPLEFGVLIFFAVAAPILFGLQGL